MTSEAWTLFALIVIVAVGLALTLWRLTKWPMGAVERALAEHETRLEALSERDAAYALALEQEWTV